MLRKLQIQHYAIIDSIEIDFSPQLNIITGETGAGKSILMGALSLILGERADSTALKYADKKCVIEGYFKVEGRAAIESFLEANELDSEEELVLRREIAPNGKSRAFINDTPVSLQQMKELASLLVDLHQQFDTLNLGEQDFQRKVVDALAGNTLLLQSYQTHYQQWLGAKKELDVLLQQKEGFQKELDYHQFLYDELAEQAFKENELEALDAELQVLSHAEAIKSVLSKLYFDMDGSEEPIISRFKQWQQQLHTIEAFHPSIPALTQRLKACQIELQDIADELDQVNHKVLLDDKRIEWINERLAAGYKLLKKHAVNTTAALLQIQQELSDKLQAVLQIDDTIQAKQQMVDDCLAKIGSLSKELGAARRKQAVPLASKVNELLVLVGMPNAKLQVSITDIAFNPFGSDQIEFLFDANNSNRFEPIRKVASGGELSRLMLCIKSLVAESVDLATLIFDEIDTGISGEAAKQVGLIMKRLSSKRQIICITHQPQIAGKADAHFYVYKENQPAGITTQIRLLNLDERVQTIAQMLSGETPTAAALENAREMMLH